MAKKRRCKTLFQENSKLDRVSFEKTFLIQVEGFYFIFLIHKSVPQIDQ